MNIEDPLLEQSLYQEVFVICMLWNVLWTQLLAVPLFQSRNHNSADEINDMCFVCGYVAYSSLKHHEQKICDLHY